MSAEIAVSEEIQWQYAHEVPDSRKQGRTRSYLVHVGERMDEGYRILWIHSEVKEALERKARENHISKAEQALERLSFGLNQRFLKTREQIEQAIKKATQGASAYLSVTIHEQRSAEQVQVGRGRPGPNTRYEEKEKIHYRLEMQEQKIDSLPIRPAGMHTKKPTWRTIVDSFHGVHLATIEQSGKIIHPGSSCSS